MAMWIVIGGLFLAFTVVLFVVNAKTLEEKGSGEDK